MIRFRNREDAGRRLAAMLVRYQEEDPLVLALPRGGVPVARAVATALGAPMEVFVVRKLGVPWNPELGMGAIAEGGTAVVHEGIVAHAGVTEEEVTRVMERELVEIERRVRTYRGGRPAPEVRGRTVILVDDGIATGGTIRAAIRAMRERGARKVVVAAPVCARDTVGALREEADAVVCVEIPEDLFAIGMWYDDFAQLSDDDVRAAFGPRAAADREEEVSVPINGLSVRGTLGLPEHPRGLVLFAHGSGSSRHSPRNRYVARTLRTAGFGTLLMDLLTADEEEVDAHTAHLRFDIGLLSRRLVGAIDWLTVDPRTRDFPVALFGASTGAAAALRAAVSRPDVVRAVVSRGGRPDLAGADILGQVRCPVMLIVGGADAAVISLNRDALAEMPTPAELAIVPNATHLFEEPGALEEVARLAADWLRRHVTVSVPA